MADLLPVLEMMENRWMRAWMAGDSRTLKALTSPKFRMVLGSKQCVILDAASWVGAAKDRFHCASYRFGDSLYGRDLGAVAIFATHVELEMVIDGIEWNGPFWVTDLWQKSRVRRNWRIVERVLSRLEDEKQVSSAIRALQLWR